MPLTAVADLVAALQRYHLLDPAQLDELAALEPQFPEPKALARELVKRGWVTPYQVNQLFQGRGLDLVLGSYVLLERVGEGGMGQVFKARNWKLGRVVALKVIRPERLANPTAARRFQREILAAARLDHPNVVHAHDAEEVGSTHFLVMEYVEGADLSQLVQQRGPLPVAEACDCVRQAALGLQHAFESGLVHRDIKPSNLLLSRGGVVKVLDMGLARREVLDAADDTSRLTQEGQLMGTADYLAPEQARNAHAADIRADLYSLGCTFYYLLTGEVPFPGGTALEKLIRHQVEAPTPLERVRPDLPPAVVAVVGRLLAKRPEDRFQTPAELADALAALGGTAPAPPPATPAVAVATPAAPTDPFGELVPGDTVESAERPRPPRRQGGERFWLLAGVGSAALFLAVFLLAAVLVRLLSPGMLAGPPPRGKLLLESAVPNARLLVKRGDAEVLTVGFPGDPEMDLEPGTYTLQLAGDAGGARLAQTEVTVTAGGRQTVRVTAEPSEPLSGWALVSKPTPLQGVRGWTLATRGGRGAVHALAYEPGGRLLATANEDGVVRLLNPRTGELVRALVGHAHLVKSLAWSADGDLLASADEAGAVRLWRAGSGKPLGILPVHASSVAWAPAGKTLACAAEPGVVFWDPEAGREAREPFRGRLDKNSVVAWSAKTNLLALSVALQVQLWQADSGKALAPLVGHLDWVRCLAWSPDGKLLASGGTDRCVRVWKAATGTLVRRLAHVPGPQPANAVAWSPDGKVLAFGGWAANGPSSPAYLWDTSTWTEMTPLDDNRWGVEALAWSPDGSALAGGGAERAVRCWAAASGKRLWQAPGHAEVGGPLAWSADGRYLATACKHLDVKVWEVAPGQLACGWSPGVGWVASLAWSPDGRALAAGRGNTPRITLVDAPVYTRQRTLPGHTAEVTALAWSPDGNRLASGSLGRTVRLHDVAAAGPGSLLGEHQGAVRCLAWSPDGKLLASAGEDRTVCLWPAGAGEARRLDAGMAGVRCLAWSPDGKWLAWGGTGGVRAWEAGAGSSRELPGPDGEVTALAWRPSGPTLVALGDDATLRLWDAGSGKSQLPSAAPVGSGTFSPDGRLLAQGGRAYTVRIWEALTGQLQGTVVVLSQGAVVIAPDGRYRELGLLGSELVVVVETERGQETVSPSAFAQAYGWSNDPDRVRLLPPADRGGK